MIKETEGNLLKADAEALVNAVNCVGVMGKGIALQFRKTFPKDYFQSYKRACENGDLQLGKVRVYELRSENDPRFIIDFPTKDHWRDKSKIEYVESGLQSLSEAVEKYKIKSIAVPALGSGLGGLDWNDVKPLIENAFAKNPKVEVLLFLPKS